MTDRHTSRRSSEESGLSSFSGSRQPSPFPRKTLAPVVAPYPPNAQYGVSPQAHLPGLHPMDRSDLAKRRSSDISTASYRSLSYNRLSRNSSGYGSQSNLAVIRGNQLFHKFPAPVISPPARGGCRRQSDTVICEADSSSSFALNGKEIRRSSEPARHLGRVSPRDNPAPNHGLQLEGFEGLQERELISNDFDPTVDPAEFDAYLRPEQLEESNTDIQPSIMSVPQQTQRLRHYPYAAEGEGQCDQNQPRQDVALQTIHHRPAAPMQPMPEAPHMPRERKQSGDLMPERETVDGLGQPDLWQQQGEIQEKLWLYHQQQQQCQGAQQQQDESPRQRFVDPFYSGPTDGHKAFPRDVANVGYEDLMVNGMTGLSTDNQPAMGQEFPGNGNMVVSDMNSLLTSLLEEDKYLEMKQNAPRGMPGNGVSIF